MGAHLRVKVPWRYPPIDGSLWKLLAEDKGGIARSGLKEVGVRNREPMNKKMIEGSVPEAR